MVIVRKQPKEQTPFEGRISTGRISANLEGLIEDDSPQYVPPRTERGIEKALKSMEEIIHNVADQDRGSRIEEPGVIDPRPLKIKYSPVRGIKDSPETLKMMASKRILEQGMELNKILEWEERAPDSMSSPAGRGLL